jgi:YlmC/YmxH family sporulation protein
MRFSVLCEKEVISANDCRCLGNISDIEFNSDCGEITALIVPGPGKYFGLLCRESEYRIPWKKVIRIGPDIILVDFCEQEMKYKV